MSNVKLTQHAKVKSTDTVYTVNNVEYPIEWPAGTILILKYQNKTLNILVNDSVVKTFSGVESYAICRSFHGGLIRFF